MKKIHFSKKIHFPTRKNNFNIKLDPPLLVVAPQSLPHFVVCVCVGGSLKSRNFYELQFTPAILSTHAFCDSPYAALCLLLSSHASTVTRPPRA